MKWFKKENKIRKPLLITHTQPKSIISEQYRNIRTSIQYSIVDRKLETLLVTSAEQSEGKTTISSNLAIVFAQQGKKVLFVDGDLRRPSLHYVFRVDNLYGLTTVLTKQKILRDCVQDSTIHNLSILASGPIPPNPSELLASKAMDELLNEALQSYDLVIFDTPPLLAVTDAKVLANKVDGVILVVKSEQTQVENAIKVKNMLTGAKGKLLGVVLNNRNQKDSQNYYYSYK
ncbi:MAG: CpsD/CapB family tyrosine-protein kinase [Bacillaceae bacterium]